MPTPSPNTSPLVVLPTAAVAAFTVVLIRPEHVWYAVACTFFGLIGALGRDLFWWENEARWQRRVGSIVVSIFAAWMMSLLLWDKISVPLNLAASGGAAWLGAEGVNNLARFGTRAVLDARTGNKKDIDLAYNPDDVEHK